MSNTRFELPDDLNFDDLPPARPPVEKDENGDSAEDRRYRRSVEKVGRRLERWAAKLVPGASVIAERQNGAAVLIVPIPADDGESCDFRARITIQDVDGSWLGL